jgi:diphthine synthase
MTLHLIGLGLDKNTISSEARQILQKCDEIFLESYTVDFPYSYEELEHELDMKITILNREEVESERILEFINKKEIALLVYGDSLSATTHAQLILSCKQKELPYKIYHNASILIAVAQTGLQLYKFGKTASMPLWKKNYEPTSFLSYYKENTNIKAHTLILTDITLDLKTAIEQLEAACNIEGCEIKKVIVISNAGLDTQKIYHEDLKKLKNLEIKMPFCLIIPGELHFHEEEALKTFKEKV